MVNLDFSSSMETTIKRELKGVIDLYANKQNKRSNGTAYREIIITFIDNQKIAIRVKIDGSIWQVYHNEKLDSKITKFEELQSLLEQNRTKYQQLLAKAVLKLPPSMKTALPDLMKAAEEKKANLLAAIAETQVKIAELKVV